MPGEDLLLKEITEEDLQGKGVIGQPDTPNLTALEMQKSVEQIPREVIIPAYNEAVSKLNSRHQITDQAFEMLSRQMDTKVDKEDGKGLSSNDFTDKDKEKLDNVEKLIGEGMLTKKDVLVRGNTDPFVPELVYDPATKDYVDRMAFNGGGSGGGGIVWAQATKSGTIVSIKAPEGTKKLMFTAPSDYSREDTYTYNGKPISLVDLMGKSAGGWIAGMPVEATVSGIQLVITGAGAGGGVRIVPQGVYIPPEKRATGTVYLFVTDTQSNAPNIRVSPNMAIKIVHDEGVY